MVAPEAYLVERCSNHRRERRVSRMYVARSQKIDISSFFDRTRKLRSSSGNSTVTEQTNERKTMLLLDRTYQKGPETP
jgi:hypothetical protein